ncbi:MAG: malate/lactate/ureidoglycolate dehydrogenase [Pseudomonadota bacterium]
MNHSPQTLKSLALALMQAFGSEAHEAEVVASHLVEANLTGHDSHGVGMLPMYGDQVAAGHLIPNQTPEFHAPIGAVSVVNAKCGFGHHMALQALDHALKTVPEHKVAILGMKNSGHVSRVGTYSEYCAQKGYVSIHMVNVLGHAPLVAPYGSRQTGFSTNPVSIAMPVDGAAKPLLDMATSTIAFGKVRVANNKGETVPSGVLLDGDGLETRDPKPMAEDRIGALAAFGAHKGSGLGIFVELLTGALVGDETVAGHDGPSDMVINTLFSIIIDPSAFGDPDEIASRTSRYYNFVKSLDPAKGAKQVLMPGDPENISRAQRGKEGIPVDDETIRQIIETGERFGLERAALAAILE